MIKMEKDNVINLLLTRIADLEFEVERLEKENKELKKEYGTPIMQYYKKVTSIGRNNNGQ